MADLGAIGKGWHGPRRMWEDWMGQRSLLRILAGSDVLSPGSRDDTDGKGASPCFKQERYGVTRGILWPVTPGVRTFKIWCKHSGHSPYPRIVLKADPLVGLREDAVVVASSSTAWQELSVALTVVQQGVLEVVREVQSKDQTAWARWDDIAVT
jgi:hypothetical protein